MVKELEFFTKLEEQVEENFNPFVFLNELKAEGKINSEVFNIINKIIKE